MNLSRFGMGICGERLLSSAGFGLRFAVLCSFGLVAALAVVPVVGAGQGDEIAVARSEQAILMENFVVSATRISRNPWRYASVPGFEILSRAPESDTNWWLRTQQRGRYLENFMLPKEWRCEPPVPYTFIIDDTDLKSVPAGQVHLPPVDYHSPLDALTWGPMSDTINLWIDPFQANDADTFAENANLYGVDTMSPTIGTISRERLFRSAPPLPGWLIAGLLGRDCGIFRESFAPSMEDYYEIGHFGEVRAIGPGTLWVSLEETRRLIELFKKEKADKRIRFSVPSLQWMFTEAPPRSKDLALWESEAALFVRWGLLGPGHEDPATSRAFIELVRRARSGPVNEQVFADCFGFGFAEMERRLGFFLRATLAKPTSVYLKLPDQFPKAELREATADQIGRILGDWLRMQGDSLRTTDPGLSAEILRAAGRMLERAYRMDNGLPPDVDQSPGGEQFHDPLQNAAYGPPVAMKPFVVSAARIHDPGLLAVYGLYERDIGDDAKARELLEAAMKAKAGRPKAYLVLAELRYAEAIARPQGPGGKLSAAQAASVLEPLRRAMEYPPSFDDYRLLVETWAHCGAKPSGDDVARIASGVALFPRSTDLAYLSALVCAQGAYATQAAELINTGLLFAASERDRKRFDLLRAEMRLQEAAGTQ